MKRYLKNTKAITLVALVITIIVLIILATVSIQLSLGDNGIFNRAKTAKEKYTNSQKDEESEWYNKAIKIAYFNLEVRYF